MTEDSEINIIKLDWNVAIRTRPGMYIGGTENPSVLLREAIDNSIDELYGYSSTSRIFIRTSSENTRWNIVSDDGRGIPIIWDEKYKMTKTQLAITSIHTGSKFNKTDVAIGLNGVGISATNALSERFVMLSKITKDNYNKSINDVKELYNAGTCEEIFYCIEYSRGK